MKAYEARAITYNKNKLLANVRKFDKLIMDAANNGQTEIDIPIDGYLSDVVAHYNQNGFSARINSVQVSPNDSDYSLWVSWDDKE